MARKMPHGERFRYPLDNGESYTVFEAMDKMLELWKEPVSESLMQNRMAHSSDPKYVFQKKGTVVEGGQPYTKKQTHNRLYKKPKPKPKEIKLTAEEKAAAIALRKLGISWT